MQLQCNNSQKKVLGILTTTIFFAQVYLETKVPLNIKIFMWFQYRKVIQKKITSQSENGMVLRNVYFVIPRNLSIICFSLALLLALYGELRILLSIFPHLPMSRICLGTG
jgi:hypothetical protein